jgi:hypothetical protein
LDVSGVRPPRVEEVCEDDSIVQIDPKGIGVALDLKGRDIRPAYKGIGRGISHFKPPFAYG